MVELTVFIDDIEERHISGQVQAWNRAERQKIGQHTIFNLPLNSHGSRTRVCEW